MAAQTNLFEEPARILIVDTDPTMRQELCEILSAEGYVARGLDQGATALQELQRKHYNVAVCALNMPGFHGLEVLTHLQIHQKDTLVIFVTEPIGIQIGIEAMKRGAYDVLVKPMHLFDVVRSIERGLHWQKLQQENVQLREAITLYKVSEAIAQSRSLDVIFELILESTLKECQTDVVSLVLRDSVSGNFKEHNRKFSPEVSGDLARIEGGVGELDLQAIASQYPQAPSLLVNGIRAMRFFQAIPKNKRWVSLCSVPLQVQNRLIGMINTYSYTRIQPITPGKKRLLSALASRVAASIENAKLYEELTQKQTQLIRANSSIEINFRSTLIAFAQALEENDLYTSGHSSRVSQYAQLIGHGLYLPDEELDHLTQAALMHDIGKIGIPNEKLNKPGKLTPEETAMFRTHSAKGKRILEPMPFMTELIPGAFCHHENYDGSGYPQGLVGENIPLIGRIVAIADTYDAMTSDRCYRKALRHEIAVAELERCSGSQFDPHLVETFLRCIEPYRLREQQAGHDIPK